MFIVLTSDTACAGGGDMAAEDFCIRTSTENVTLLLVHHPQRRGNLAGRHGKHRPEDEKLSTVGQWEATSLGFYIGQRVVIEALLEHRYLARHEYLFDFAAATQGRSQQAAMLTRRGALEAMRTMEAFGLAHVCIIPNWDGIDLGQNMTGLTEAQIASLYPVFAQQWQAWRENLRDLPPELPEPDSEAPDHFAQRVVSGLRYALANRRSRLILAVAARSVLQVAHNILEGNNPNEVIRFIDPPYGWAEEWELSPDQAPRNVHGEFLPPYTLAAKLPRFDMEQQPPEHSE